MANNQENDVPVNGSMRMAGWSQKQETDYNAIIGGEKSMFEGLNISRQVWKEEYGDVAPRDPAIELELFGEQDGQQQRAGLDFSRISEISVTQEGTEKLEPITSFSTAGLHDVVIENLKLAGYVSPTPIQKYTIAAMMKGYDVIGVAQTGSGKTAAYLLPILSKLMGKAKKLAVNRAKPSVLNPGGNSVRAEPLVLIIVPARELAVQIFKEARKFSYRSMLRPCVVYGGPRVTDNIEDLQQGCDILVGTPGRLLDLMYRPNILSFNRLKYIVIDEADEMLHNDWDDNLRSLLSGGQQDEGGINYCLFSATFPKQFREIAREYLNADHIRLRVGRAGSTTKNIQQTIIRVEKDEKFKKLLSLLNDMSGYRTIIFCNRRMEVDNLDYQLFTMGLPVTSTHSDRTQLERELALRSFRSGVSPILIATGVMARGIDVQNIMHVINYDMPSMEFDGIDEYTHRIGRTGRMGHRGLATSLYTDDDEPIASVLTRTLMETNQEIPEFLQEYVPEGMSGNNVKFEDDSDSDENGNTEVGANSTTWGTNGERTNSGEG
ncbi:hypothetical protein N3K66_000637 [Trichothecium roseum]|uniref:Uncharacterized protein n=1 Tax=Trichothecium roseum TaxID=47278 RepID=A0ACC0VDA9_9HYPO|nr:hypothetical protein N3K66_000637 [Trichothecium roseum]